jgi:hypothetical protein
MPTNLASQVSGQASLTEDGLARTRAYCAVTPIDLCSQPTVSRWENAPTQREVMGMTCHDRPVLPQLRLPACRCHLRYRRHLRRGAWQSATGVCFTRITTSDAFCQSTSTTPRTLVQSWFCSVRARRRLSEDRARVRAMREHLGDDFPLMADANLAGRTHDPRRHRRPCPDRSAGRGADRHRRKPAHAA